MLPKEIIHQHTHLPLFSPVAWDEWRFRIHIFQVLQDGHRLVDGDTLVDECRNLPPRIQGQYFRALLLPWRDTGGQGI